MSDRLLSWEIQRRNFATDEFGAIATSEESPLLFDDLDEIPDDGFQYQVLITTENGVVIPYNIMQVGGHPVGFLLTSDQYETFFGITATDSRYLLSVDRFGTANRLSWTWPARFIFGADITPQGLYLQRSEISMNPRRYPLMDNVYTVDGTAPDTESGWSTIHSWTGTALDDRPTGYDDVIADTKVYAYRLCLVASRRGHNINVEVDWNVCLRLPPVNLTRNGLTLSWNLFANAAGDLRPWYTLILAKFAGQTDFDVVGSVDGETASFTIEDVAAEYVIEMNFDNYHLIDFQEEE